MPKDNRIKKVLLIGSGPIVIGQAAEFDYAGTQGCRALREEGVEIVLVNSNPATIMTDPDIADHVYMEPLTVESLERIIEKEKPDSLLPTLGGQAGLNLAVELSENGFLAEHNVRLIGASVESIKKAEDRQIFRDTMSAIGEPIAPSKVVTSIEAGRTFAEKIGYPVVLRPAYTLGGSGGGIADTPEEMEEILANGLRLSLTGEVLVEQSIAGWKEIEFEVMRDSNGSCITVCSMENIDPVGIHTGDSIVVAPTQTLGEKEYQMLRSAALHIISEIGISGGCNVQFALNPDSFQYCVIEVNPRVSRSSALASKAAGYPIAKIAAKLALGYRLDELPNAITRKTTACFEPMLDYCVVKMPRFPFDKFPGAERTLSTQMQATGEVMGICTNFEGALMKSIRCLEQHVNSLLADDIAALTDQQLTVELGKHDDRRLWRVAEALRRGMTMDAIHKTTKIDVWFLSKIRHIVEVEDKLKNLNRFNTVEVLREAKDIEFPDAVISQLSGIPEDQIKELRKREGIRPGFRMVDSCAAEFEAETPYFYSAYESEDESGRDAEAGEETDGDAAVQEGQTKKKVLILGSGPIRIGQGVEFDFCSVHAAWAFQKAGWQTVIINNNPETVSTDFDIADRLYFEPLTPEDVEAVVDAERPDGAVVQFGGQTAISLTAALAKMGVPILGTSADNVDAAEDRERFDEILRANNILRAEGKTVFTVEEGVKAADELGYPVLVRPSYVLGGQGMRIAVDEEDIRSYIGAINRYTQEHPILIDQYLPGREIEVDAVSDGNEVIIPGIMEHIEKAGIHSGDSISVYPAPGMSRKIKMEITQATRNLARSLHVKGLLNIQYNYYQGRLYCIEVNPRASRTVPFISKVTGVPLVPLAVRVILGENPKKMEFGPGLCRESKLVAIKMPVFSFEKIPGADIALGPEMKSTGEVLGIAHNFRNALEKAFSGAGIRLPKHRNMVITVRDSEKNAILPAAEWFTRLGYHIYATAGTAKFLEEHGIESSTVAKLEAPSPNLRDLILSHKIDLVIDVPPEGADHSQDGFRIRRLAVETGVTVLTASETATALAEALFEKGSGTRMDPVDIAEI
ncbi:MAG: carbamoyl-phosphate synthase large subunit [Eubacterium sp.]|nr:carbamoyl-phosphate synthase large subunit [Eubacterium sp.]